ncbi:MAG: Crp/Fnr family transcriptional regulator [Pseudomonadota bacterium]
MGHTQDARAFQEIRDTTLEQLAIFEDLDPETRQDVVSLATPRRLKEGDQLFRQGERATEFFVMIEGYARLQRMTEQGEQIVFHHVSPGQLFGISKVTESATYAVTCRAATDCLILVWPAHEWERVVAAHPGFARRARHTMGARMRELADRVVDMTTRSVEQRIASTLLRLTSDAGRRTTAGVEIAFPVTRQDIAETTGATMHSVSRIMSKWQRAGYVTSSRRKVVLREPDMLSEIAVSAA